jgi:hypothetical protein
MRSYWNLISVGFLDFSIKWHLSHAKSPDFRQPACSRSLWAGLWSFHGHLTPGVSDKNMGGTCRPIAIWTTRWKLGRVDSGFLRKSMGSEKRNISRASYMEFICNSYGIHIYINMIIYVYLKYLLLIDIFHVSWFVNVHHFGMLITAQVGLVQRWATGGPGKSWFAWGRWCVLPMGTPHPKQMQL